MKTISRPPRAYAKILAIAGTLAAVSPAFAHGEEGRAGSEAGGEVKSNALKGTVPLAPDVRLAIEGTNEVAPWEKEALEEGVHPQTLKFGFDIEPQRGMSFSLHGLTQQDSGTYGIGGGAHISVDFPSP